MFLRSPSGISFADSVRLIKSTNLVTGTDFVNGKIDWDNCHYVAKDRFDQDKNIQIQNDDILITKDGSLGKTALVKGLDKPATLNSGVFVIRPLQESYDPAFVYYILSSFVFKDFLDHLSAGSTIIHLYQKDILQVFMQKCQNY